MGDRPDYPSPRSEGPNGALAASILASAAESPPPIPRMNDPQPMAYNIEGARPRLSVRRTRDPPKNSEGQIFCDHPNCQSAPPTFRRPCEWNKHMDKHDRPYKCYEPNCDKIQGFTYSGGLLRHQREVHKKNTDTKKALMCPYTDCNRSTGNGFTRQENLREHLRRRHMHNDEGPSLIADIPWDRTDLEGVEGVRASSLPGAPSLPSTGMKRRHTPDGEIAETDENGIDLHSEIKRLCRQNDEMRHENEEKGRRIQELERIVAGIQQAIPHQSSPGADLQELAQPATATPV